MYIPTICLDCGLPSEPIEWTEDRKRLLITPCDLATLRPWAFSWRYSWDKNRSVIIATACAGDVRAVSILNGALSHASYS